MMDESELPLAVFNPTANHNLLFPYKGDSDLHHEDGIQSWETERAGKIESALPAVRVAKLSYCSLADCRDAGDDHLVVEMEEVPRECGRAVAISYTWGEFDRRPVRIGHNAGLKDVYLELGQEWTLEDLKKALVALCSVHNALWMDQLCLPQQAANLREGLQSIPYIFRAFDVIALMPGSPCSCSRPLWTQVKESFLQGSPETATAESTRRVQSEAFSCLHHCGLNSWFNRVWTWQEMMYSRRISALWIGQQPSPCIRSVEDLEFADSFALKLFRRLRMQDFSYEEAWKEVGFANVLFYDRARAAIEFYRGLANPNPGNGATTYLNFCRFLLGEQVENLSRDPREQSIYESLNSFVIQIGTLGLFPRKTTNSRDYVTSVFVDCPCYEIPTDFKTLETGELLENATIQMETKLGYSLLVNMPAGLLGNKKSTGFWRPATYLLSSYIRDSVHLYGPLVYPAYPVPIFDGRIPLAALGTIIPSTSSRATGYRHQFGGCNTEAIVKALQSVVDFWPQDILTRVLISRTMDNRPSNLLTSIQRASNNLESIILRRSLRNHEQNLPDDGPNQVIEIDHHAVMYKLVAYALGLDPKICQEKGLEVMLSISMPPCVGFMNAKLSEEISQFSRVGRQHYLEATVATICQYRRPSIHGCVAIEGLRNLGGRLPSWEVGGVWVPSKITPLHEIQFMVHLSARDSFIGDPLEEPTIGSQQPNPSISEGRLPLIDSQKQKLEQIEHSKRTLFNKILAGMTICLLIFGGVAAQYYLDAPTQSFPEYYEMCIPAAEFWKTKARGRS